MCLSCELVNEQDSMEMTKWQITLEINVPQSFWLLSPRQGEHVYDYEYMFARDLIEICSL